MKAITLHQPWASLIACGAKKIETRSWPTRYRGPIAIHAGVKPFDTASYLDRELYCFSDALGLSDIFSFNQLPYGAVISIADLAACILITTETLQSIKDTYGEKELAFGDLEVGRYAWMLGNVRRIEPVPVRGFQRIWNWDAPVGVIDIAERQE